MARTQEQIMPKNKRFVPISEYQRITGLSYATVCHLCESGQLKYITTESGLRRIDTQAADDANPAIMKKLEDSERVLKALCGHLGVNYTEQLPRNVVR